MTVEKVGVMSIKVIYGFANAKDEMTRRGSAGVSTLADYIVPNSRELFGEDFFFVENSGENFEASIDEIASGVARFLG